MNQVLGEWADLSIDMYILWITFFCHSFDRSKVRSSLYMLSLASYRQPSGESEHNGCIVEPKNNYHSLSLSLSLSHSLTHSLARSLAHSHTHTHLVACSGSREMESRLFHHCVGCDEGVVLWPFPSATPLLLLRRILRGRGTRLLNQLGRHQCQVLWCWICRGYVFIGLAARAIDMPGGRDRDKISENIRCAR